MDDKKNYDQCISQINHLIWEWNHLHIRKKKISRIYPFYIYNLHKCYKVFSFAELHYHIYKKYNYLRCWANFGNVENYNIHNDYDYHNSKTI